MISAEGECRTCRKLDICCDSKQRMYNLVTSDFLHCMTLAMGIGLIIVSSVTATSGSDIRLCNVHENLCFQRVQMRRFIYLKAFLIILPLGCQR